MASLWASGWDEADEAELQAAASGNASNPSPSPSLNPNPTATPDQASGNASRRVEIERREARGAQGGPQQLREEEAQD